MSRSPASRRRPAAKNIASSGTMHVQTPATESVPDGWQRSLDLTRSMLGATLDTSREWMQGLGDWQQAQATSLRHASERIAQVHSETDSAADWPSFCAAQAHLAGTQWTQAMDDCSALVEQAVQIEARLLEHGRTDAARWSKRWLDELQIKPPQSLPNPVDFDAPLAMIGQAQTALNEMSKLWTQAFYNTTLPD